MTPFDFHLRTRIIFGEGTVERLGDVARELERDVHVVLDDEHGHRRVERRRLAVVAGVLALAAGLALDGVDDVIDALLLTGCNEKADGEIFNLGGNEPVSLGEIATELVTLTGRGSVVAVPFPPEQQLIEIAKAL